MSILVKTRGGLKYYRKKKSIILTDINGNVKWFPKNKVKQMIIAKEINPIDFQLDKYGRLISKKVDYKHMCRSFNVLDELNQNEQMMILFYGMAKINQLSDSNDEMHIKIDNILDEFNVWAFFDYTGGFILKEYWCIDKSLREKVIRALYMISTL